MTQYRARLHLTPLPVEWHDKVIDLLFDGAYQQVAWFRKASAERVAELAASSQPDIVSQATRDAYDAVHVRTQAILIAAKASAYVTSTTTGAELSFDLPTPSEQEHPGYHEIAEDGRRLWVRQAFEDHFLNYMHPLKFEQAYQDAEPVHAAFNNVFADANRQDALLFSIDGEQPSGLTPDSEWTCLADAPSVAAASTKLRAFLAEHPNPQARVPYQHYNILTLRGLASIPCGAAREIVVQEMQAMLTPLLGVFTIERPRLAGFGNISEMLATEDIIWVDDDMGQNTLTLLVEPDAPDVSFLTPICA